MIVIKQPRYIKCSFKSDNMPYSGSHKGKIDIFFAETRDLHLKYHEIRRYISYDEHIRAEKFVSDKDRKTYVTCHGILRLILAQYLRLDPLDISFRKGINNKPKLDGNPIYFNLTHAKEAFAIAVSRDYYVGIDLEQFNKEIEIHSISRNFFSKREYEFIFQSETGTIQRFFLLWTRKEALLKALGTGITNDLKSVELCNKEILLNKLSFDNLDMGSTSDEHYIYSKKILNYFLSIASPHKASIGLNLLNSENITSYLI